MATPSRPLNAVTTRAAVPTSIFTTRMGQGGAIGIRSPRTALFGAIENRRLPVKTLLPMLPRIGR
jgi:hypothetical protein